MLIDCGFWPLQKRRTSGLLGPGLGSPFSESESVSVSLSSSHAPALNGATRRIVRE